jgi:hypothetical protein
MRLNLSFNHPVNQFKYKDMGMISFFRKLLFLFCFLAANGLIYAQELPLITDKQGTFRILSRTDYTNSDCGFTKAEITENLKEITGLVNTIRKNPVLSEMKGFDSQARIYNIGCDGKGNFGIPSRISFEFASWYRQKDGTPARILIEPPNWDIIINKQKPLTAWPFSAGEFSGNNEWFTVSEKKETIQPGIDLYDGEVYVLYNPDRPPYWLPVTVKEAFTKLIAHWKVLPDKVASEFMLQYIESEYATVSSEDMDKPARTGTEWPYSQIGTDPDFPPILRVNPEYWNKKLPRSSIQFLYCRIINNRPFLKSRAAESLKGNSISYSLYRFEESLDINTVQTLLPLIRK